MTPSWSNDTHAGNTQGQPAAPGVGTTSASTQGQAQGGPPVTWDLSEIRFAYTTGPLLMLFMFTIQQYVLGMLIFFLLIIMAIFIMLRIIVIRNSRAIMYERVPHEAIMNNSFGFHSFNNTNPLVHNSTRPSLSLAHLRLAMMDRDFNANDYEMLLSLDDEVRANAMNGVPQNQIEMLPTFPVPAPKANSTTTTSECSICLEPKVPTEIVRSLPCLHTFHVQCIDPWLQANAICPVCKYKVILA